MAFSHATTDVEEVTREHVLQELGDFTSKQSQRSAGASLGSWRSGPTDLEFMPIHSYLDKDPGPYVSWMLAFCEHGDGWGTVAIVLSTTRAMKR